MRIVQTPCSSNLRARFAVPVIAVAASLVVATSARAQAARDYISVVGSSTVYPFATVVAEQFGRSSTVFKAPKIESTGSGGGIRLFCNGVGVEHPDIANSSRRIRASELASCVGLTAARADSPDRPKIANSVEPVGAFEGAQPGSGRDFRQSFVISAKSC